MAVGIVILIRIGHQLFSLLLNMGITLAHELISEKIGDYLDGD